MQTAEEILDRWRLATRDVSPTLVERALAAFRTYVDQIPALPTREEFVRPTAELVALQAALAELRAASRHRVKLPRVQTPAETLYGWGLVLDAHTLGVQ